MAVADVELLEPDAEFQPRQGTYWLGRSRSTGSALLIKTGLRQQEVEWTVALARSAPHLVPRYHGWGSNFPGLGEATGLFVIQERVPFTLSAEFERYHESVAEAGIAFGAAAPAAGLPMEPFFTQDEIAVAIEGAMTFAVPGPADAILRLLPEHWAWVTALCPTVACHGDLHPGNVLTRTLPPGPARETLLIGFAPRLAPWVFEPAWPTIRHAFNVAALARPNLIDATAAVRQRRGLPSAAGADLERLQSIVLAWYALDSWGRLEDGLRRADPARRSMVQELCRRAVSTRPF